MTEFTSKWQNFSPEGSGIAVSKVAKAPSDTFATSIAEGLGQKNSTACTCLRPVGPAGCGPNYPVCSACGYTWYCKTCGGCRQCATPGRKVKTEDGDLPFPIGFGGLDSAEVARAERINLALGVTAPLDSKLSVINWLYQHYRDLGHHEIADQLKQAYWQLREPDSPLLALTRMGELDEATLLRRLVNGQKWLGEHLHSIDGGAADAEFSKALAGWTRMEADLRQDHGYQGCIHGEGGRCPDDAAGSCDV